MSSVCITSYVNNNNIPIRPTFANLYKWPESEVEFVKIMNSNNYRDGVEVDHSLSCRQIYLRSYKFSRKKLGVTEKTMKCFSSIKESYKFSRKKLGVTEKTMKCFSSIKESYKFSRKKFGVTEKTIKCFSSIKESVVFAYNKFSYTNIKGNCKILGRAKCVTHAAVSIFRRLISRSDKVHMARHDF